MPPNGGPNPRPKKLKRFQVDDEMAKTHDPSLLNYKARKKYIVGSAKKRNARVECEKVMIGGVL
jgi:hypothetical protein